MPTVIPPAEKLPLVTRKNLRDTWEAGKADREAELTKVMGVPWKIDINPNAIWVYAKEDDSAYKNLGWTIDGYVECAINKIKYFMEPSEHGEGGREEMNKVCSKHTLTLSMDETGKVRYCGCDVKDGVLRILFGEKYLGISHMDALNDLERALSDAADDSLPLSYQARVSIEKSWDQNAMDIEAKIAKCLHNPGIKLTPNFLEVYAALKADPEITKEDGWDKRLGMYVTPYFEAIAYALESNNFENDDMLREGFEEAVSEGEIKFRIVKELAPGGAYCQSVIENGVLYMQTLPKYFGVDYSRVGGNIVDLL